ncbi:MAG: glycosyltransferase family 4 protein [Pseudomonadota bacterium]
MTPPLRLGIVIGRLTVRGGLERDCLAFANAWRAAGAETVLISRDFGDIPTGDHETVRVHTRGFSNHGRMQELSHALPRIRADHGCDILFGFEKLEHLDVHYSATLPWGIPSGLQALNPRRRVYHHLEQAVHGQTSPTVVYFLSEQSRSAYEEIYGPRPGRTRVLPVILHTHAPIHSDRQQARHLIRKRLGLPDGHPLLITVAIQWYQKGVDQVLSALPRIPDAHYVAVGLKDPHEMRDLAQRLGVLDRFTAMGYEEDVLTWLSAADLTVHPARNENTGLVILESIEAETPIIATTNCGYAPEIVKHGAGLVLPEDPAIDRLARVIRNALVPNTLRDLKAQSTLAARQIRTYPRVDQVARQVLSEITTYWSERMS